MKKLIPKIIINVFVCENSLNIFLYFIMSLLNKVKKMIHPAINIENFINAGNAFGAIISVKNT
jgi:hypothetical protein